MRQQFITLSLGLGLMLLATMQAFAQQSGSCGDRARVLEVLESRYGETRQSIGLGPQNQVVEVFASEQTGSWTIIATSPEGRSCLIASGQSFEALAESLPPAGNDA